MNPEAESANPVKLMGMLWGIKNDTLSTNELSLNESASTKRKVLSSLASNFDIFNIVLLMLNEARVLCSIYNPILL